MFILLRGNITSIVFFILLLDLFICHQLYHTNICTATYLLYDDDWVL